VLHKPKMLQINYYFGTDSSKETRGDMLERDLPMFRIVVGAFFSLSSTCFPHFVCGRSDHQGQQNFVDEQLPGVRKFPHRFHQADYRPSIHPILSAFRAECT
jgi:hypothetical protein